MTDRILENDLNLLIPAKRAPSLSSVNKYGYSPDGVQAIGSDIWDRADATPTQATWVAPLGASPHVISSTSGLDTNTGPGVGANKLQIYGLTDWDTPEVSEIIELNGLTGVNTVNNYVIIHRMRVIEYGAIGPNVGVITAVEGAVTTAQINAQQGQTQMAIYGFCSQQVAYMTNWYASIHKASGAAADVIFQLQLTIDPDGLGATRFIVKETRGLQSNGTSNGVWEKKPYARFEGPGILKVRAFGSADDIDAAAGFDLILRDK